MNWGRMTTKHKQTKADLYEQRKSELPPDLSPKEYRDACKEIARELKL